MQVSLTFDNGPTVGVTSEVLDTLALHRVRATFFVIGENLSEPGARKLAERARDEGHQIGNHSYTHPMPLGLMPDPQDALNEVLKGEQAVGDLAGTRRLFRPAGRTAIGPHMLTPQIWDYLKSSGHTCVLWNVICREWERPDEWPEFAIGLCRPLSWSVPVLHDLPTGAMRQLDRFLGMLIDAGADFSQDFPVSCTPIRDGREMRPKEELVTSSP